MLRVPKERRLVRFMIPADLYFSSPGVVIDFLHGIKALPYSVEYKFDADSYLFLAETPEAPILKEGFEAPVSMIHVFEREGKPPKIKLEILEESGGEIKVRYYEPD